MSHWLRDFERTNPDKARDIKLAGGNHPNWALRAMVKALELAPRLNSNADNARLAAAKRLLRNRY